MAVATGLVATGSAHGQELLQARMSIVPETTAWADVTIDYVLVSGTEDSVPVVWLDIAPARVLDVSAAVAGVAVPVVVDAATGARWAAHIPLPSGLADTLTLTVQYRVANAARPGGNSTRYRVPTVAVAWAPGTPTLSTFRAVATASPGTAVFDPFPSSGATETDADGVRRVFDLQVVPAFIGFATAPGRKPVMTLPLASDAAAVLVLATLAAFGLRRFQRAD